MVLAVGLIVFLAGCGSEKSIPLKAGTARTYADYKELVNSYFKKAHLGQSPDWTSFDRAVKILEAGPYSDAFSRKIGKSVLDLNEIMESNTLWNKRWFPMHVVDILAISIVIAGGERTGEREKSGLAPEGSFFQDESRHPLQSRVEGYYKTCAKRRGSGKGRDQVCMKETFDVLLGVSVMQKSGAEERMHRCFSVHQDLEKIIYGSEDAARAYGPYDKLVQVFRMYLDWSRGFEVVHSAAEALLDELIEEYNPSKKSTNAQQSN